MDVNIPILTLKRKPLQPTPARTADMTVVVKHARPHAAPEMMKPVTSEPKKPRTPCLIPISETYALLMHLWATLFDICFVRLMKICILQDLIQDKERRKIPLSNKKIRRCLKAISRSPAYLDRCLSIIVDLIFKVMHQEKLQKMSIITSGHAGLT